MLEPSIQDFDVGGKASCLTSFPKNHNDVILPSARSLLEAHSLRS